MSQAVIKYIAEDIKHNTSNFPGTSKPTQHVGPKTSEMWKCFN